MQKRAKTATSSRRGMKPASRRATTVKRSAARRSIKPSARRSTRRTKSVPSRAKRTTPRGTSQRRGTNQRGAKTTTDHDLIRRWAEARQGQPATVIRTATRGEPGILRIDFPGFTGEGTLKPIAWDEWFGKFDERNLAFLYQDRVAGKPSRFFKLIKRPKG